jgi:hypothetical protein
METAVHIIQCGQSSSGRPVCNRHRWLVVIMSLNSGWVAQHRGHCWMDRGQFGSCLLPAAECWIIWNRDTSWGMFLFVCFLCSLMCVCCLLWEISTITDKQVSLQLMHSIDNPHHPIFVLSDDAPDLRLNGPNDSAPWILCWFDCFWRWPRSTSNHRKTINKRKCFLVGYFFLFC